ncbi:MAG: pilin [Candidatus Paceibacterota bacterium]
MRITKKTIVFLVTITLITPSIVTGANCVILGRGSGLSSLIAKIFTWSLWLGGLLVFGALVFGGFMYLISGGNRSRIDDAKSYITGAVIAIVILLGSYLLLQTINPQLLRNTMDPGTPSQGICLYGENENGSSTRCCFSDSQEALPEGFEAEELQFQSIRDAIEGAFWFDSKKYEGSCSYKGNYKTDPEEDGKKESVSGLKSFYLEDNKPGVYLYKNPPKSGYDSSDPFDKCTMAAFPGEPYQHYLSKEDDLGGYKNEVGGIVFKSAGKCKNKDGLLVPEIAYGAVLHGKTDYKGKCTVKGVMPQDPTAGSPPGIGGGRSTMSFCTNRTVDLTSQSDFGAKEAESITPFALRLSKIKKGKVTFYEEIGHEGDFFTIDASTIEDKHDRRFWSEEIDYPIKSGDLGVKVHDDPDDPDEDKAVDRILSIEIQGSFMVVLGKDKFGGTSFIDPFTFEEQCKVIKNSDPNLTGHNVITYPEDDEIGSIGIIPLRQSN